jgi:hypothetical protein
MPKGGSEKLVTVTASDGMLITFPTSSRN